jgi:hypothetical protein
MLFPEKAAGGQITWSAPFTIKSAYAREHCDFGYALAWHTVEGRTVSVGIGLVSGERTRRGLYVAMSRGARRNEIYAYPSAREPAVGAIGRPRRRRRSHPAAQTRRRAPRCQPERVPGPERPDRNPGAGGPQPGR